MRVLIQRVSRAQVLIDGKTVAAIGRGFVLLIGITHDDHAETVRRLAVKVANLRIFEDEGSAMNRSGLELAAPDVPADGSDFTATPVAMLVVSQFTLYADARKGRRPSFVGAARPDHAAPLVEQFAADLRALGLPVATGVFGADMAVDLTNDGPVTIWLDSADL